MRIVIDLQGAQSSGSRHRGIGRYSLALAQAIVRNRGGHEVLIVLNSLFPDTIEPICIDFKDLLPQENIRVWNAPGPVCHIDPSNNWRRKAAELSHEAFLASLHPDVVYITSLFEGLGDDAVTSVKTFTQTIPTVVTLYDLIPLINRRPYLENPAVEAWYENKLDQLRRADLLLGISESSRQEGIQHLGFSESTALNIGTAADPQFHRVEVTPVKEHKLRERYGLSRPYVMYTGGIDFRKNIEGLIRAYALLPAAVREEHQLAIVCSVQPESRRQLEELAAQQGLAPDEVVLTGFVPEDDLVTLYNMCKAFVFPSWHEGFGLPALEAMSCGAPVIGANTSSLPEVIGLDDALFDPRSDKSIAEKLEKVLIDERFRTTLIAHGIGQAKKFSWDESAKRTIAAFEQLGNNRVKPASGLPYRRPKLAYVSPLPPERSGIADYSAELLQELARHYEIDVIVAQSEITNAWVRENCTVRTVEWFQDNSRIYERVLYHFGNSHYHQHMFDLLEQIPGIVVLHDFFLSSISAHMEYLGISPNRWARDLYYSHGYMAVQERFHVEDAAEVIWKYPCNKAVLDAALGVIVHSSTSRHMSEKWFGAACAADWAVIPLMRAAAVKENREQVRQSLGIGSNAFVVCSFGHLGLTKLNHRLLDAWLASSLSRDARCHLIFVGENESGEYGKNLIDSICRNGVADRVSIAGWTDQTRFRQYLAAADVGVQLRTLSRGETSAAVLDCLNYGLATIVNANGSMAELPANAVWMMPDEFKDAELVEALEALRTDEVRRRALSETGRALIQEQHAPRLCADKYAAAIEHYYERSQHGMPGLINALASIAEKPADEAEWVSLAHHLAQNAPGQGSQQLLVDISELVQRDSKTGIQRVVRSVLAELLYTAPPGFRVEPVYAIAGEIGYRYARRFTLRFLGCPDHGLSDDPVQAYAGDIFIGLDLQPDIVPQQTDFYTSLRRKGVEVHFVVYDLLPVLLPDMFPDEAAANHARWLEAISNADGVACISKAVATEMVNWLQVGGPKRLQPLGIGYFHLGSDLANSMPSTGLPQQSSNVLRSLACRPTFLMVGTMEVRKGHLQAVQAFELLWSRGHDVNLTIVGKQGWMVEELIAKISDHAESNVRLHWLNGISDEYLEKIYEASTCLIAASEGEGFGLPLIEAAQHNLPIIARNIPVFQEVAGEHAFYFSGSTPEALADDIEKWLKLHTCGHAPKSSGMPCLTWKQSTQQLLDVILGGRLYQQWMPDGVIRFWASDSRVGTQVGRSKGTGIVTTGKAGYLIFGPYLPVAAGKYQVVVHGEAKEAASAHVDVAIDKGACILGASRVRPSGDGSALVAIRITLDSPCTDLEVRIWVGEETEMCISLIEIEPCSESELFSATPEIAAITGISSNTDESYIAEEVTHTAKVISLSDQNEGIVKQNGVMPRPVSGSRQDKSKRKKKR